MYIYVCVYLCIYACMHVSVCIFSYLFILLTCYLDRKSKKLYKGGVYDSQMNSIKQWF